jgi:hypothetical protein
MRDCTVCICCCVIPARLGRAVPDVWCSLHKPGARSPADRVRLVRVTDTLTSFSLIQAICASSIPTADITADMSQLVPDVASKDGTDIRNSMIDLQTTS